MKNWLKFIGLCFMVFISFTTIINGFKIRNVEGIGYGLFYFGIILFIVSLLSVRWFYNQYLGTCPICKKDGIPRKSIKCPYCQSVIKKDEILE